MLISFTNICKPTEEDQFVESATLSFTGLIKTEDFLLIRHVVQMTGMTWAGLGVFP